MFFFPFLRIINLNRSFNFMHVKQIGFQIIPPTPVGNKNIIAKSEVGIYPAFFSSLITFYRNRSIYEVINISEIDRKDANRARRSEGGKPEVEGIA